VEFNSYHNCGDQFLQNLNSISGDEYKWMYLRLNRESYLKVPLATRYEVFKGLRISGSGLRNKSFIVIELSVAMYFCKFIFLGYF
jgi:hypothetical protein